MMGQPGSDRRYRRGAMLLAVGLFTLALVPGSAGAAETTCFTDPADDTVDFDTRAPTDEPRADLLEHCIAYGPTLSLNASVAQLTNPGGDPNWSGATSLGWFLDTDGDGEGEFFAGMNLDESGALQARVMDIRGDEQTVACDATPAVTDRYAVSGIEPACLDGATSVQSSPGFFYDTVPEQGDAGQVHFDSAPGGDEFDGPASGGQDRATDRLAGLDRFGTAVAISQAQFPDPGAVDRVYLARSHVFADAVAGGVLTGGPILLVPSCGAIPTAVTDEIERITPDVVIALGGPSAICDDVLNAAANGRPAGRLAGPTRFETAVAISKFQFPQPADAATVYLARSRLFADAVAGGSLTRGPILLVPSCGPIPSAVTDEIDRLDPGAVVALGGPSAICDDVLEAAAGTLPSGRLAGATRFETAVAISQHVFPEVADTAYLARSDIFADAVTGGVLTGGPVLLVPSCGDLPRDVGDEISRLAASEVVALGGTAAICDAMLQQAADA